MWALEALIERGPHESRAQFSRDAEIATSTLSDLLKGRRQPSEPLLEKLAETAGVDVRAIAGDPHGVVPPLQKVAEAARRLAPHLNGHDFGLRRALNELEQAGL